MNNEAKHGYFSSARAARSSVSRTPYGNTIRNRVVRDYTQASGEELLQICADLSNIDAWDEFLRRFHHLITSILARTLQRYSRNVDKEIDDLEAEVYLRLCANGARALREFVPRHSGSAFGYIKVIAVSVVYDLVKRTTRNTVEDLPLENFAEPDVMEWRLFLRDIDDILRRKATEKERHLFWLYYLHGMTAKAIAELPTIGLSVKGVESVYGRLGRMVKREFAVHLKNEGERESRGNVFPQSGARIPLKSRIERS